MSASSRWEELYQQALSNWMTMCSRSESHWPKTRCANAWSKFGLTATVAQCRSMRNGIVWKTPRIRCSVYGEYRKDGQDE